MKVSRCVPPAPESGWRVVTGAAVLLSEIVAGVKVAVAPAGRPDAAKISG